MIEWWQRSDLKLFMKSPFMFVLVFILAIGAVGQTRRRKPGSKPLTQQAPKGSPTKYSAFQHSSDKHKSLSCNVCHVRAAPREDGRFAFGKPNGAGQTIKPKDERQFTIEFPHDKHQNVIASDRPDRHYGKTASFIRASFFEPQADDQKKPDYNNCSGCHLTNNTFIDVPPPRSPGPFEPAVGTFKTTPHGHESCFNCHWKNQKPAVDDCAGCHKPTASFVTMLAPRRISAKFSHEGGKGEHVMECTTCHINITRASTLRGLTPDVPIAACVTCHKDNKKTTYPKITTIEGEVERLKKTSTGTYCLTADVGTKKPHGGHEAAAQ